ncbi:signal peptide protein [Tamlana sedimentorum]|uniref:Signal peptide protein n=1 Tax=Neotamlana sedimentorum TaxID=1435349 RepID=A0A0D7WCR0_9FLAO|nr:DUF2147 domain-containing protein [Tamlana sedimentorum]KJD36854.1 signal peptide protein [Tamlana sedimentorum]
MKYIYLLLIIALSISANGQTILGSWETYDDDTNEKKAVIEIYEMNNLYFAKIIKNIIGDKDAVCDKCKEDKKGKPIVGLIIIENLKKNGNKFDDGTILDPESGEIYSCHLEPINKDKLKVRGFLGFSVFGRTQYWIRKE